ncbi:MAG: hypothetical protein WBO34_01100 [Gammaproteobacteria bacterium]
MGSVRFGKYHPRRYHFGYTCTNPGSWIRKTHADDGSDELMKHKSPVLRLRLKMILGDTAVHILI